MKLSKPISIKARFPMMMSRVSRILGFSFNKIYLLRLDFEHSCTQRFVHVHEHIFISPEHYAAGLSFFFSLWGQIIIWVWACKSFCIVTFSLAVFCIIVSIRGCVCCWFYAGNVLKPVVGVLEWTGKDYRKTIRRIKVLDKIIKLEINLMG